MEPTAYYASQGRVTELDGDPRAASNAWRWTAFLLAPAIWTAPLLILSLLVTVFSGLLFVPNGWIASPFLTLALLYLFYRARRQARERNGKVIVSYLHAAVRLNLPLPAFLKAAENSETTRRRRQLSRLREALERGTPVAEALRQVADVPEDVALTLAAHESVGQLKAGMDAMAQRQRREEIDNKERPDSGVYRFYPLFILIAVSAVLIFTMIFIMPKFREIFKDFKTPLPPWTQFVMNASDAMTEDPVLGFLFAMLMVLLVLMPMSIYMQRIFLPSWPEPKFARLWAWMKWRLPLLRGMERDAAMAASSELLSEAVEAGVTLPVAVRQAAALPMNPAFRQRLAEFARRLTGGEPAAAAAEQSRLPALLVGMLGPMATGGAGVSGGAMFSFLARYYRQKFSRTVMMIEAAAGPFVVVIMGGIVLSVMMAIITALVALLEGVMGEPGRVL